MAHTLKVVRQIIPCAVAGLLLSASVAKIASVGEGPSKGYDHDASNTAIAVVDGLLAAWLLSGVRALSAWVMALLYFVILGGVALAMGLMQRESCGCFGQVEISPWRVFVLDAIVVSLLVVLRPRTDAEVPSGFGEVRQIVTCAVLILLVIGSIVGLAPWGMSTSLAILRGDSIVVEPRVSDIGDGTPGEFHPGRIHLKNIGDKTVNLIGASSTCACIFNSDFPVTIAPGETLALDVTVKFAGNEGRFRARSEIYTDDVRQPVVHVSYVGRVVPPN